VLGPSVPGVLQLGEGAGAWLLGFVGPAFAIAIWGAFVAPNGSLAGNRAGSTRGGARVVWRGRYRPLCNRSPGTGSASRARGRVDPTTQRCNCSGAIPEGGLTTGNSGIPGHPLERSGPAVQFEARARIHGIPTLSPRTALPAGCALSGPEPGVRSISPSSPGPRVAHDPTVGTATTWSARSVAPRRPPPPSPVVKRRVGSIDVLDRLLDDEAIEDRQRAARSEAPGGAGRRTMSTERNRDD
jgi:hypothetical protein